MLLLIGLFFAFAFAFAASKDSKDQTNSVHIDMVLTFMSSLISNYQFLIQLARLGGSVSANNHIHWASEGGILKNSISAAKPDSESLIRNAHTTLKNKKIKVKIQ